MTNGLVSVQSVVP